jgi:hypothetical protein
MPPTTSPYPPWQRFVRLLLLRSPPLGPAGFRPCRAVRFGGRPPLAPDLADLWPAGTAVTGPPKIRFNSWSSDWIFALISGARRSCVGVRLSNDFIILFWCATVQGMRNSSTPEVRSSSLCAGNSLAQPVYRGFGSAGAKMILGAERTERMSPEVLTGMELTRASLDIAVRHCALSCRGEKAEPVVRLFSFPPDPTKPRPVTHPKHSKEGVPNPCQSDTDGCRSAGRWFGQELPASRRLRLRADSPRVSRMACRP